MAALQFKSTPDNFRKEFLGLKSNTVREFGDENDERKKVCDDYISGKITDVKIYIINTQLLEKSVGDNREYFFRQVTDITKYKNWYIISWRHE